MRRPLAYLAAACLVAAPLAAATPAAAATPTAYSASAFAAPGSMSTSINVGGLIGGLLAPILNPVLAQVNSLANSLVQVPQSLISALSAGVVNATGTVAATPASAPDQGTGFPTCGTTPWTSASCYTGVNTSVNALPLVQVGLTALRGYAQAATDGTKPYQAAASAAVPQVSLLGIPLVSAGLVTSRATCPTTSGSPSATSGLSSMSLLGGAVALNLANGTGVLSATLSGVPLVGSQSVTLSGDLSATVSLNNNLLTARISLSASQLVSGLGIGVADGLIDSLTTSTMALTVTVGPGNAVSSSGAATAWGLDVGVDISGAISFNVAGLATVSLAVPTAVTASGGGNALDLKLAYSSCSSGGTTSTAVPIVPNSLI